MIATCPSCGEKGKLPTQFAGLRIKCKKCATSFVVASPGAPALPEKAAPKRGGIEVDGLDESSWSAPAAPDDDHDRDPEQGKVASLFTISPFAEPTRPETSGSKQYKILTPKDRWFENRFDLTRLEEALNHFAKQGWVVRSMATPQVAGFSGATHEELIVLLERPNEP